MANNWYVITGGPSSGKTTLLKALEKRGYTVIHEVARQVIDDGLAQGLTIEQIRADEQAFQQTIFDRKFVVEAMHDPNEIIFLDRGIHDTHAYFVANDLILTNDILLGMKKASYNTVFLLEPLPVFEKDYARTEDNKFTQKITELLQEAYAQHNMPPVRVPVLSPAKRVQFILERIKAGKKV